MNILIQKLKNRWNSESPALFKKITKYSIIIGSAAFGIITVNSLIDLTQYGIPSMLFTICSYILVGCGAMGLTSKITKE